MSERISSSKTLDTLVDAEEKPSSEGFWNRALFYVKNPENKAKVQLGAASLSAGVNVMILYYVNKAQHVPFWNDSVKLKAGLSFAFPLFILRGYDSLAEQLGIKSHWGMQAGFAALNWGWGMCIEAPLYTALGNPNALKSAVIFSCISQVTGSAGIAYDQYRAHIDPVLATAKEYVVKSPPVTLVFETLRAIYEPIGHVKNKVVTWTNGKLRNGNYDNHL